MVAFLFLSVSAIGQTVYEDYQDGKIWFKIGSDVQLDKGLASDREADIDPRDLPFEQIDFVKDLVKEYGITHLSRPFFFRGDKAPKLKRTYKLEFSEIHKVNRLVDALAKDPNIDYAEKKPLYRTTYSPDDPKYPGSMWHLPQVNAAAAWDVSFGNSDVVVAVSDNAVDIDHEDLTNVTWNNPDESANGQDSDNNGYVDDVNGYDLADGDNDVRPASNTTRHGTHVSGTVGGETDNSTGVASLGFGVTVMPIKIGSDGQQGLSAGTESISYAAENDAHVLNMSWGGQNSSQTMENAVNDAHNAGTMLIAAAGNDGVDTKFYPAGYQNVMSVGATDKNDDQADFGTGGSNYGSWLDISAPGIEINSTTPGNSYNYLQGTSMASPNVAGLAGLLFSLQPSLAISEVENCITSTADPINWQGGAGRINAEAAMNCMSSALDNPPEVHFSAKDTVIVAGNSTDFTDKSLFSPTSWSWTFQGGNPGSSNDQHPSGITYSSTGTYDVTLEASNSNGTNTKTKTDYIEVVEGVDMTLKVEDCSGNGIENVNVSISNSDFSYNGVTDVNGEVSMTVANGTYNIRAAGPWGYKSEMESGVVIDQNNSNLVRTLKDGYSDDFVSSKGWFASGNVASGAWERGKPNGTEYQGSQSNPGSDVSNDFGEKAYVTGNDPSASVGDDDIDDGVTTLESPDMDLSSFNDPMVKYGYWFFNAGGNSEPNDSLVVILDNGSNSVRAITYTNSASKWRFDSLKVSDYITPTANMTVKFEASDLSGSGHLVNAGVDKFRVVRNKGCPTSVKEVETEELADLHYDQSNAHLVVRFRENHTPEKGQFRIVNAMGQIVQSKEIEGGKDLRVDLANVSEGIYFFRFTNGERSFNRKFMKR